MLNVEVNLHLRVIWRLVQYLNITKQIRTLRERFLVFCRVSLFYEIKVYLMKVTYYELINLILVIQSFHTPCNHNKQTLSLLSIYHYISDIIYGHCGKSSHLVFKSFIINWYDYFAVHEGHRKFTPAPQLNAHIFRQPAFPND